MFLAANEHYEVCSGQLKMICTIFVGFNDTAFFILSQNKANQQTTHDICFAVILHKNCQHEVKSHFHGKEPCINFFAANLENLA